MNLPDHHDGGEPEFQQFYRQLASRLVPVIGWLSAHQSGTSMRQFVVVLRGLQIFGGCPRCILAAPVRVW